MGSEIIESVAYDNYDDFHKFHYFEDYLMMKPPLG